LQYFVIGDALNFALQVKDKTGAFVTPATVVLTLIKPDETTVVPTPINNPSTGNYNVDYVPTASGEWQWRYETTGPGVGESEGRFIVKPSAFKPGV
jgi:hypothetical protein